MAENEKRTKIFNKVSEIVADHFDIDRAKITDDLNLKTDLDADSIDFVEFVLELEDTFNAEIADDEAEKLSTIGEVVDYIDEHTNSQRLSASKREQDGSRTPLWARNEVQSSAFAGFWTSFFDLLVRSLPHELLAFSLSRVYISG